MDSEGKVRLANRSDLRQIVTLLGQLSPFSQDLPWHRLELLLEEILQDDKYHLFVYELNERVIGSGMLMIRLNLSHGGKAVAYAENIVVDEGHRGKGIGAKIMSEIIETAKYHYCYKLLLDCSDKNIMFYEKFGFEITPEKNMRLNF